MPSGGQNKLPEAVRRLRGTARRDRGAIPATSGLVRARCPRWLSPDAKKAWRYLAPRLGGVLRETDLPALALLCAHFGVALAAAEALGRDGPLVKDPERSGVLRKNPAAQLLRDAGDAFVTLATRFGLTPQDRARLVQPEPEPKDGLAEFLAMPRPVSRQMEEEDDDDGEAL